MRDGGDGGTGGRGEVIVAAVTIHREVALLAVVAKATGIKVQPPDEGR